MADGEKCIRHLLDLPREEVKTWLNSFDAVVADCDGVLWHENVAIAGSPATINAWLALGKRVHFVTNNSGKTRHDIWQRANALGFRIKETDIIVPGRSIARYISEHQAGRQEQAQKKVYLIGNAAMGHELEALGLKHFGSGPDVLEGTLLQFINEVLPHTVPPEEVCAVVVGFDEHFNFVKIMKAARYLVHNPDCLFLCTNADVVYKTPICHIPDTGALVSAIETCVGRAAVQLGKPSRTVCEALIEKGELMPQRTLMIGDSNSVDVQFGKNCGFQTLLVGSGQTHLSDLQPLLADFEANKGKLPDFYIPKMGDLLEFL